MKRIRKRAVAYCRVSTEHEDQLNSLQNQKEHWERFINSRDDMEFCGLYADEGLSGTSTEKRAEFNRMMRDAEKGCFDLILTKEVSRFGRNIVDVLMHTRRLKQLGIGVWFESDGINTMEGDGELRLSIMAALAQEESRKTSQRVKWGQKRAMEKGIVFGADRILGYDLESGVLRINEEEAEIVREIYSLFLKGESLRKIAEELNKRGIRGKMGGKFNHSSIRCILENEKYCGDLVQGKFVTPDYLCHKQKRNEDREDMVVIRDHHPAIIKRETWQLVQRELANRRRQRKNTGSGYSRQALGGKIFCGYCGKGFISKSYRNRDGSSRQVWICSSYAAEGRAGCLNRGYIRNDVLMQYISEAFKKEFSEIRRIQAADVLTSIFKKVLKENTIEGKINELEQDLERLEKSKSRLIDLYIANESAHTKESMNRKLSELEEKKEVIEQRLSILRREAENTGEGRISAVIAELAGRLESIKEDMSAAAACIDKIIISSCSRIFIAGKELETDLSVGASRKKYAIDCQNG